MAALFHGQIVNISGLARDAATARTTIEGYLRFLKTDDGIEVWPVDRRAEAVAQGSLWP